MILSYIGQRNRYILAEHEVAYNLYQILPHQQNGHVPTTAGTLILTNASYLVTDYWLQVRPCDSTLLVETRGV